MMQRQAKPSWALIAAIPLGIAAVMTPAFVLAAGSGVGLGGGGFDSVVHGIESRYHAHANRIPFMFLISGVAGIATHGGVHNLHIAEFENFHGDADGSVDGEEFNQLIEDHVGKSWSRMIRDTSRNGKEQSLIYIRDEKEHVGMLIVDLDHNEINVVQISVNPDQLMKEAQQHTHRHQDQDNKPDQDSKPDQDKQDKTDNSTQNQADSE